MAKKKKIKKKFKAEIRVYSDGTMKIIPLELTGWERVNQEINEDKQQRVPRAQQFLSEYIQRNPGPVNAANLVVFATKNGVYRGPLMEAARAMGKDDLAEEIYNA